jgi:transcriptional regulator GlxA family with amidase domain
MSAARDALTTATAPEPLAQIAHQVGYSNLGRFDAHYFDAFGRLPEEDFNPAARPTTTAD